MRAVLTSIMHARACSLQPTAADIDRFESDRVLETARAWVRRHPESGLVYESAWAYGQPWLAMHTAQMTVLTWCYNRSLLTILSFTLLLPFWLLLIVFLVVALPILYAIGACCGGAKKKYGPTEATGLA